jgi:chromosome partitioning protein
MFDMTKIYSFSTNKGGVLKSTLTLNIGAQLSKSGYSVLLVDMDNQGNLATSFGEDAVTYSGKSIYNVLVEGKDINSVIVNKTENLDLLPSDETLSFFEEDINQNKEEFEKKYGDIYFILREELKNIKKDYDYILIDTPPNAGAVIWNVYSAANEVIIPVHPEPFCVDSLLNTIVHIREIQKELNPSLTIKKIIPTKVKTKSKMHKELLVEIKELCESENLPLSDYFVRDAVLPSNAVHLHKLPLMLTKLSGPVRQDLIKITKEVE